MKTNESNNEDCYNCTNLRKFNKDKLEESITAWKKAKAKGWFKNIADSDPYIAKCRITGLMTKTSISKFDKNCRYYSTKKGNQDRP